MNDDYDDGRFAGTTRSTFRGSDFVKKPDKEPVTFEARVEAETAKAYLVEPTVFGCNGKDGMLWMPKSQIIRQDETGKRTYEFTVKEWWWGKQIEEGLIDA